MSERKILNSWKEIAAYLGCGIRTAQRLESVGLPVRRPSGRNRSAVVAIKDEIDAWRLRSDASAIFNDLRVATVSTNESRQRMREQMRALKTQLEKCRARSEQLRARALELRERRLPGQAQLSN